MADLETRLRDAMMRSATQAKLLKTLINNNATDLSSLNTSAKGNLVAALNELKGLIDGLSAASGATIDDALTSSSTKTWSINKITSTITTAINALLAGAPSALDTLDELAAAINDDASFAASITTMVNNRVRHDINSQGLTLTQKQNARTNIDAYGSVEIGNPDTNFVAVFESGLL